MIDKTNLRKWVRDDLTNDAVFGNVMGRKENCLQLLRAILPDKKIKRIISIQRQKHISLKMLRKATRFDILAIDDQKRKYNIEMQTTDSANLLKRALFYSGRINDEQLKQGEDYRDITASYVIFFCTFDPFGFGEAKNEIAPRLINHPQLDLGVDQHIIFFNSTAVNMAGLTPDLQDFLKYLNGMLNAQNDFIQRLERHRQEYISGKEWNNFMLDFTKFEEETKETGKQEGIKLGRREEKMNGLKTLVTALRNHGFTDNEILTDLTRSYGQDFTKTQLQEYLRQTK